MQWYAVVQRKVYARVRISNGNPRPENRLKRSHTQRKTIRSKNHAIWRKSRNGKREMESEKARNEKARNEKWKMRNGKWIMENEKWIMERGLGGCPKPLLHGLKRSTSLRLRGANAPSATKPGPSVLSDLSRHVAGEPTLRSRFDALAPESIRVGPRFP